MTRERACRAAAHPLPEVARAPSSRPPIPRERRIIIADMSPHPSPSPEVGSGRTPWFKRPSVYLYALAVLGFAAGQVLLLSERLSAGSAVTLCALVPLGLALLGNARLTAWVQTLRSAGTALAQRLSALDRPSVRPPDRPVPRGQNGPVAAVVAPSDRAASPRPWSGAGVQGLLNVLTRRFSGREVKISRTVLLVTGGALLLSAQPFLLTENFLLGFALALPALVLLVIALVHPAPEYSLGPLDQLLKGVLLGLPGAVLIILGGMILWKHVLLDHRMEILGLALTAAGVFLILALLPNSLPDPEGKGRDPLDLPAGAVRWPLNWPVRLALVVIGAVLLYLCSTAARTGHSTQALLMGLAGVGAVLWSFPWMRTRNAVAASSEPGVLLTWAVRVGRVLAFVVAVYLGVRAQVLFQANQLMPALLHGLAAGLVLALAFREPRGDRADPLRERPLAWYWEAMGVVLLLAAAIWLREFRIEQIPYGIEGDEAGAIINAREIFVGARHSIVAHFAGQPVFYLAPLKLAHQLFGLSNFGIKFMAMVYGVLSILAIYLLARLMFGPRTALAVAALMTFSRWHIHFSRFGYGNTLLILTLTLGFYFLLNALRTRRKWQFVLAGMSWSLALQTEVAARLLPLICFALLGFLVFSQRRFFRRNWRPLLALLLGAWLTGSAICMLYARSSTALMGRAASVSIFSNDPNAPRDVSAGIIDSIKGSLTMLNWRGDSRSRHNGGMVAEPMLDLYSGLLFLLGFTYSLFYWKRFRYYLLFMWFFGFMSASVFAIEAPQAHRAFGILPAVFLFAGVFIDRARRLLTETFGRPGTWVWGAASLLLFVPIGTVNYQKYFDTQPAFDSNCCEHAKYIESLGPNWVHYIMTAYLWQGHPPFMAFAPNITGRFFYSAGDVVPSYVPLEKNVCYSFVFEYGDLLPTIKYFYPKGEYREVSHPKYGTMFTAWEVAYEDILATRGLIGRYYANPDWAGAPALTRRDPTCTLTWDRETWPLKGPGSVAWEGTVLLPHRGRYEFALAADDETEVRLGAGRVLRSSGGREDRLTAQLAGGLHRLRIKARHLTPNGKIRFLWSCSTSAASYYLPFKDPHGEPFAWEPVPPNRLFTYLEPKGLLETYYASASWSGEPLKQDVQPALVFAHMGVPYGFSYPCTVEYLGWLQIDRAGAYPFQVETPGYGEVRIDDRLVVRQNMLPPGYADPGAPVNPISLSPGRHRIRVRWYVQNGSNFKLWWTPPGGTRAIVPASVLSPLEE